MLGGVVGPDWPASALLVNIIIYRTRSNSKTCAYTFTYNGAQLILALTCSRMPGYWALTRFLTYSHISASRSHLIIIFTYMETPTSPLSSYVHFILLCRLPPMSARLVCGFVDVGAYELTCSSLLPPPPRLNITLATPRKRLFSILGDYVTFWLLCLLSGTASSSFFFFVWSNSRRLKTDT